MNKYKHGDVWECGRDNYDCTGNVIIILKGAKTGHITISQGPEELRALADLKPHNFRLIKTYNPIKLLYNIFTPCWED